MIRYKKWWKYWIDSNISFFIYNSKIFAIKNKSLTWFGFNKRDLFICFMPLSSNIVCAVLAIPAVMQIEKLRTSYDIIWNALEYATTDKQKRDINNSLDHIDPTKREVDLESKIMVIKYIDYYISLIILLQLLKTIIHHKYINKKIKSSLIV